MDEEVDAVKQSVALIRDADGLVLAEDVDGRIVVVQRVVEIFEKLSEREVSKQAQVYLCRPKLPLVAEVPYALRAIAARAP